MHWMAWMEVGRVVMIMMTVVMMMMSDDVCCDDDDDSDGEDKSLYAPHETCAEQLEGMVDK